MRVRYFTALWIFAKFYVCPMSTYMYLLTLLMYNEALRESARVVLVVVCRCVIIDDCNLTFVGPHN